MSLHLISDIWKCALCTVIVGNVFNKAIIQQIKSINKNKSFNLFPET